MGYSGLLWFIPGYYGVLSYRGARYICNRLYNTSSVRLSEMIGHLSLESLAARRNNMRFQMMSYISRTPAGDAWQRWLTISTNRHMGSPRGGIPLSPSNNVYTFSFLPNTIPIWKNGSLEVVSAPNLPKPIIFLIYINDDRCLISFLTPVFFGLHIGPFE